MKTPAAVALHFDDGSALPIEGRLGDVFSITFEGVPLNRLEALTIAAVDHLWQARRLPDRRGQEADWTKRYPSKAGFAQELIESVLSFQFGILFMGSEKGGLVARDPETGKPRVYKEQDVLREKNRRSLAVLARSAVKGLVLRGLKLASLKRFAEARQAMERAVEFDGENGQSWLWLGIMRQREGDNRGARPDFERAARLLKSPYLGEVACPACGWIPAGQPMWKCDSCGEKVDKFATEGRCVLCSRRWDTTACIACDTTSPHGEWM
jgi:hypothetical protein